MKLSAFVIIVFTFLFTVSVYSQEDYFEQNQTEINEGITNIIQHNRLFIEPFVILKRELVTLGYSRLSKDQKYLFGAGIAPIILSPVILEHTIGKNFMAYGVSFNPFVRYYVLDEGKGMFVGLYSSNRYSQWELENIPLEIIECISNSVNGRCDGYQADDTFKRVSKISVIGIEFGGTYFFNDTFFVEYTTGLGKKWGEKVSYNNRTGQGYDNYGAFPIALKANFNFGYNF